MSSRRVSPGVLFLRSIQVALSTAVAIAAIWGLLGGCREQPTPPVDRNAAPETFVTSAPGDSQTAFYRVRLHWFGTDRDGSVTRFEVAVTESLPEFEDIEWTPTRRTDSLVTFHVEETREVLGHRFYVRAIDDEGKVDETPAWVFFGARDNLPPEVTFDRALAYGPNGETMLLDSPDPDFPTDTIPTGWGVTFAWSGVDRDVAIEPDGRIVQVGSISSFSHRMLPVESEFLGGSIADTAQLYDPDFFFNNTASSIYAFDVRAVDDAGLSGSGTITRSFVWNRDPVSRIQRYLPFGETDSVVYFLSRDSIFHSGDTLALPTGSEGLPDVKFFASAYDPDPVDGDYSVSAIEWRYVAGAIINSWQPLDTGNPVELLGLTTGNYIAMVRSVDRLDRVEGTPDSVRFYVNFSPRFVTQNDWFQQTPLPGDVYPKSLIDSTGLVCRFLADNPDAGRSEMIRYGIRFAKEGEGPEPAYHHRRTWPIPGYDAVARADTAWTPGNYTLYVKAEDNKQTGGDLYGTRSRERLVPFTVTPD